MLQNKLVEIGDMLGQLNATREFNKTLWRTDKEETAKYRPPCGDKRGPITS